MSEHVTDYVIPSCIRLYNRV